MHKYPFCFTFLVSRIFLLIFFFFVPCLLRFITSIYGTKQESIWTRIYIHITICAIRLEQCSLCNIQKKKRTHITFVYCCLVNVNCLIFAWLCFFFLLFFLYKSLILIYMIFFLLSRQSSKRIIFLSRQMPPDVK